MNVKDSSTLTSNNQKYVEIQGYKYKIYSCGTVVDLQKESESFGNILESKELLSKYHPEVLKLSILLNKSQGLKELTDAHFITSEKRLYYFYQTINSIKNFAYENSQLNEIIAPHGKVIKPDVVKGIKASFVAALNDNFNTSLAISDFIQVFKYSNALLNNANENPLHKLTTLNKICKAILAAANLLGILLEDPEVFILGIKEKYIKLRNIDMKEVAELIKIRQEAKSLKNYKLADELKAKLDQKGIIVQDSKFSSGWDIKELFD